MARKNIAIALGAAVFTLLLISHLISNLGFPLLTFLNIHYDRILGQGTQFQIPINPDDAKEDATKSESRFLLGVGKADITG